MALDTLENLFLDELRDVYHAEHQILRALPKMAKTADSPELQAAFEEHLRQTQVQVGRLDQVFRLLGKAARGKVCKGMQGLLEEGKELMEEEAEPSVLDAGLISAAQRVEHYEIAAYGSLRTYARELGHEKAAQLLQTTLDEEGETDKKLTALAERVINMRAAQGS